MLRVDLDDAQPLTQDLYHRAKVQEFAMPLDTEGPPEESVGPRDAVVQAGIGIALDPPPERLTILQSRVQSIPLVSRLVAVDQVRVVQFVTGD